jgi:serine phosphatase RsbU (regulator of sigma subunit)
MNSITRISWAAALAGAIFVAWLAVGMSGQVGIAFLYSVPIGLVSWWFGLRAGLVAVCACLVLYVIGAAIHPVAHFGLSLVVRTLVFLAAAVFVAVVRARLDRLEHSAEELDAIRAALTPPTVPKMAGLDVGAAFVPSELGLSGDFYLLTNGPDGSTIAVVGDVVGHGPRAARLATFVRARLAAFAATTSEPAEILALANKAIVERPGRREEIVSAVCLRFKPETSGLAWAVAGHPRPLRLPGLESLECEGQTMLLGVDANLALTGSEVILDRRDGVLIYTDGATDVRKRQGGALGLEGLLDLLAPLAELPASVLAMEAEKAVLEWADGSIRDDLCILALRPAD